MRTYNEIFRYRVGEMVWHKQRVVSDNVTKMTVNGEEVPTINLLDGRYIIERRLVDYGEGALKEYVFRPNIGYGIDKDGGLYIAREDELVNEEEARIILRLRESNSSCGRN